MTAKNLDVGKNSVVSPRLDLSTLAAPHGARKSRKRVGCGESSGHGKTSTRGGKGQTARTGGGVRPGFEGGQMPLYRRLPKLGFRSRGKSQGFTSYAVINVADLQRFEDGTTVDAALLVTRGFAKSAHQLRGLKVLGSGELSRKLTVKANAVSESARKKIEAAGGTIELL